MKDLEEQRVCVKLFQIGKNLYGDFSDVATGLWRGLFEPYAMLRVVSALQIWQNVHRVTYTRCRIYTTDSPDDENTVARYMQSIEINIRGKELCVKLVIYKKDEHFLHNLFHLHYPRPYHQDVRASSLQYVTMHLKKSPVADTVRMIYMVKYCNLFVQTS